MKDSAKMAAIAMAIAVSISNNQAALSYVSYGLIDRSGKSVIAPKYAWLRYVGHEQYWAVAAPATGKDTGTLLDRDGKPVNLNLPDGCRPISFDDDSIVIEGPQGKGVTDRSGQVIIPPKYASANHFSDALAVVARVKSNSSEPVGSQPVEYLVLDRNGQQVGKLPDGGLYLRQYFSDGLLTWQTDNPFGGTGYIERTGKFVLKPGFVTVSGEEGDFSDGLAAVYVERGPKRGAAFINNNGKVAIGPFAQVQQFQHGFAVVEKSGRGTDRWGVINRTGQFVAQPKHRFIGLLGHSTFVAQCEGNWIVINNKGETLLHLPKNVSRVYASSVEPRTGLHNWSPNSLSTSEIAPDSVLSIPIPVDEKTLLRRIPCAVGGTESTVVRWGFADNAGQMIIAPAFDKVWPFRFGAAVVRSRNKYSTYDYGLIDENGTWLLKPEYGVLWQTESDRVIVGIGPRGFDPLEWKYPQGFGYGVSKRKQFEKLVKTFPLIGLSRLKLGELIGEGDKWLFSGTYGQSAQIKSTVDEPIYMIDSGGCLRAWSGFQVHYDRDVITRWRFVSCTSSQNWIKTNKDGDEAATKLTSF